MVLFRRTAAREQSHSAASNASEASSAATVTPSPPGETEGGGGTTIDHSVDERRTLEQAKEELWTEGKKARASASTAAQGRWFLSRRRFLFPLGIFLGVLIGWILIQPGDIQDLQTSITLLLAEYDLALPEFPEFYSFDFSLVAAEWTRLRGNIPEFWKLHRDGREFQVGEEMRARGLEAEYPVVMIPGIISTGLESWGTSPDFRPFFREKLWGGFSMIAQVMFNRDRWIAAMMLDPDTGLDPPGAKVRAAEGIDAASSFVQGYWIWSKIIENLAVVNYDTNNLYLAPYDWRLSYYNLEERDGYFSKLKSTIEGLRKRQNRKVVITSHSMGSVVLLYFFKWVESPEHGGGGDDWVENNIEAWISVCGTFLGVAKSMAAFLSGEMKDTVQMNPAGSYVLERFFSRKERARLFRSWAGSASMWIKGGDDVWGDKAHAPDDAPDSTLTHGTLISFRAESTAGDTAVGNMTAAEAGAWVLSHTPASFQKMMETNYSFGIERDEEALARNDRDPRKWSNPLEIRLPDAPSMKIYCVYGHGKETERSYWYSRGDTVEHDELADTNMCTDPSGVCPSHGGPHDVPFKRSSWIDADYTTEQTVPRIRNGVKMGEGDGTVNLLSLGGMCAEGWTRRRWNPAGINVTVVEMPHRPNPSLPRGGAYTSDHVDILGSAPLNELIVKVATGAGGEIEESIVSDIREYARRIRWD